ncbi:aldo/keto reductase family oxidoreductase [Kosakonia pseudosacchari]|uniref:aldo/keto reductase family oxidoreductase n=1 Tax=Kosakonia pseudosacchari TaxID=1646340 RepID=UPI000A387E59|nr:aldo/keto reductase family oxidoreductase [Kosakonia pseudosacchari]
MSQSSLTFRLGDRQVGRLGYGAMQLAGPGVFGPPADEAKALQVLRDVIAAGVNHIDTSDFYGPYVTNKLIKQALYPYPDDLCIVTKVGARRDDKANWLPAFSAEELTQAVEDNLRNLGLDVMEVVNLRAMFGVHEPEEGPLEAPLEALIKLKERGLIRHIGLSNVTAKQVADAQKMTPIVCVQNLYNVANRHDDALIDSLNAQGIAYVPFFPLGGFTPLQSGELNEVAQALGATPMQVALAWLLQRSPNILLIPGTSSPQHLQENLASAQLTLPPDALAKLDAIAQA